MVRWLPSKRRSSFALKVPSPIAHRYLLCAQKMSKIMHNFRFKLYLIISNYLTRFENNVNGIIECEQQQAGGSWLSTYSVVVTGPLHPFVIVSTFIIVITLRWAGAGGASSTIVMVRSLDAKWDERKCHACTIGTYHGQPSRPARWVQLNDLAKLKAVAKLNGVLFSVEMRRALREPNHIALHQPNITLLRSQHSIQFHRIIGGISLILMAIK